MKARTREMPATKESGVLSGVLEVLAMYGIDAGRQNVGGMANERGQYVPFGRKGDADVGATLPAHFGPHAAGRRLEIETKRPGFRPEKLKGEKRAHFDRQLARLARTNEDGGFATWIDDAALLPHVLDRIKAGWRIIFIGDYPYLDDGRTE